ncbi:Metal dependent phosphohydrolase [Pedobacter cryoconitis]|uniref:Metal dependent phosphohydrolase n=1 Tax=Pedobacter cryoconitis TaxID=188932 RepID=A0A127VAD4_9SPHI|nr:hypothetical protein [Pedobacter cryoconitis]AMP98131.1 Metal dependent phosphohydrolase [Pedobacter cryoconitis]
MIADEKLADWVASKHAGQLIKRTGKPYFDHLLAVAEMAAPVVALGYETGLCHDLLEDTNTNEEELIAALISFGYTVSNANKIAFNVTELTDVFTKTAYPRLTKLERKAREAERLMKISPIAQTVKYCDLIYNIDWVLKFDQKHAQAYLIKKKLLLTAMVKGDEGLRQLALHAIDNGLKAYLFFKPEK